MGDPKRSHQFIHSNQQVDAICRACGQPGPTTSHVRLKQVLWSARRAILRASSCVKELGSNAASSYECPVVLLLFSYSTLSLKQALIAKGEHGHVGTPDDGCQHTPIDKFVLFACLRT
eukprot:1138818-Pelagomonas_calceolata.AAC.7